MNRARKLARGVVEGVDRARQAATGSGLLSWWNSVTFTWKIVQKLQLQHEDDHTGLVAVALENEGIYL